ncbi:hypothetical protein VSR01_26145 [Actinacidiphila sp. DG2A-62]|jgi:hypothetical protein|uniref:hypothetical protein n=1 Tax=Actinacidiphila sp. DG2A-62 TaxID=3108821 RepID=UPI002DB8FC90|nr:hypothetical protein [Actinacidiphila sp. DG2A-62]MEC3996802.1 hypothetical protein [Actinacidiphila sp. DG2A-62]
MTRSSRTPRHLVVDGETFLWSVRHEHQEHREHGCGRLYDDCREVLTVRRPGALGVARIVFAGGPGRFVPDGGATPSGAVGTRRGPWLNLHEPGTVRALLDALLSRGGLTCRDRTDEVDGWTLYEAAAVGERSAGTLPG